MSSRRGRIAKDERGTAVIEFALVTPVMLMILMGIIAYGQYFWMAHSLQEAANDGARAGIEGLTATERRTLCVTAVQNELIRMGGIQPALAATMIEDDGTTLSVTVSYNAASNAITHFSMVPLPGTIINRRASIQLGGV